MHNSSLSISNIPFFTPSTSWFLSCPHTYLLTFFSASSYSGLLLRTLNLECKVSLSNSSLYLSFPSAITVAHRLRIPRKLLQHNFNPQYTTNSDSRTRLFTVGCPRPIHALRFLYSMLLNLYLFCKVLPMFNAHPEAAALQTRFNSPSLSGSLAIPVACPFYRSMFPHSAGLLFLDRVLH